MFASAIAFNQPIGSWNTSNVTNMSYMFYTARNFNQPIDSWNTSNVTNMSYMFHLASIFNSDISSWNTINVTDMSYMFYYAIIFNQPIGSWNTSNVTNISNMFNSYDEIIEFNNRGQKMNWTFKVNTPISTDWHTNSALTYNNAPNSIRGILDSSWPDFVPVPDPDPIPLTFFTGIPSHELSSTTINGRQCWEITGNTTIISNLFFPVNKTIYFVAVGGGQNSIAIGNGGNGGGVVSGSFNITPTYTLTITIGASDMSTTINGTNINITANGGSSINAGSVIGSKIISSIVRNGGSGGIFNGNINGSIGSYIDDLGIYVAGGGGSFSVEGSNFYSVSYFQYIFSSGNGGIGGGGAGVSDGDLNVNGFPNTGGGGGCGYIRTYINNMYYYYKFYGSGGSGIVYLYI